MASSCLRKMLALIKYQYPRCIGVDVSLEFLKESSCGGTSYTTITGVDNDLSLCVRGCSHILMVLAAVVPNCGRWNGHCGRCYATCIGVDCCVIL